jgi:acyl-CoA thioester hydrolase
VSSATTTTYRVIFGDCDAHQVVYYANYLRLFERGRADHARKLGIDVMNLQNEDDYVFPVVEANVRYKSPARYDDLLEIETSMEILGRIKFKFINKVFKTDGDQRILLAEGYTLHACISMSGKPRRIPEALKFA